MITKEDDIEIENNLTTSILGKFSPGMYFVGDLSYLLMDCETYEGIEHKYYSKDLLPESIVDEESYLTKLEKKDLPKGFECMLRVCDCETQKMTDYSFKNKFGMFDKLKDLWNSDKFEFSILTREGYTKSKKPKRYRSAITKKSKVKDKNFYYYDFFEYGYECITNTFAVIEVGGDGVYETKEGDNCFPVDSGTLGFCRVDDYLINKIDNYDSLNTLYLAIHKGCVIELSKNERKIFNPNSLELLNRLGDFIYFKKPFETKIIYTKENKQKYFVIDKLCINIERQFYDNY